MRFRLSLGVIVILLAHGWAAAVRAQTSVPMPAEAVARPGGPTTTLPLAYPRAAAFTTDEGTWLSLDVSPDGRTIVFDLLGDLYTLPITGGQATRITDGPGFDSQPRFAPDGQRIVFVSDRSGAENLYTVAPDGTQLKALTTGEGRGYASPEWTPDGQHLVVSGGSDGHGFLELFLYRRTGGAGTKLTTFRGDGASGGKIEGDQFLGAAFGRDARYLYFTTRAKGQESYDHTEFVWTIQRYDFVTGEQVDVVVAPGGAMRPLLSPDGQWLVYATRDDTATSFRVRNLQTQEERWLRHGVQRDVEEAGQGLSSDLLPGSAFTPDGKAIITAFHGKIWRVEVPSGKTTLIPFSATVDLQLGERVHFEYPINDSTLTVTQIRDPRLSPDNQRVVFTALNHLYVMDLPHGTPRRLTRSTQGEYHPVWSPDGRWIAYVTWNDTTGAVYRVRADGRGTPERLTREGGYYTWVNYNPSGRRLVVTRAARPRPWRFLGSDVARAEAELVWLPATGGPVTAISPVDEGGRFPYFLQGDSTRIYLGTESVRWDGTDRQVHLRGGSKSDTFSPDGRRLFRLAGVTLWLGTTPFARALPFELAPPEAPLVGRRVSRVLAEDPAWSPDGTKLIWAAGRFLFIYDVARGDSLVADSLRQARDGAASVSRPAYEAQRLEIALTLPKDRPAGVVALRGARIITMQGDQVIERGDLVVTDGRITAIGPAGTLPIPAGATVFELAGKTIIPGLVDIHAHPATLHPAAPRELRARQPWAYAAALAYGVTTIRDPQAPTEVFTYRNLVATGEILGPRVFSTGPGLSTLIDDFSTLDGTRAVVRRHADYYRGRTVKQYGVGDRRARQYVLMAAKEFRLTPTLEGGQNFKENLTEAIDGYAGNEHAYPVTPLYRDVVELVARSGITYTPTLLVTYGGPRSKNYMYVKYQAMHADPKLRHFVPHAELDRRFLRRDVWFADDQYIHQRLAAQAAKIVRAGGRVGLGGHGELPGLGEHWELWLLQSGGMTPLEALRCATLFGAEAIGLGQDLGSLEVGKLADLIVLDENPLEDIHHTLSIRYVMKNGRLYDGDTLDERWPRQRPMPRGWWMEEEGAGTAVARPTSPTSTAAASPLAPRPNARSSIHH